MSVRRSDDAPCATKAAVNLVRSTIWFSMYALLNDEDFPQPQPVPTALSIRLAREQLGMSVQYGAIDEYQCVETHQDNIIQQVGS